MTYILNIFSSTSHRRQHYKSSFPFFIDLTSFKNLSHFLDKKNTPIREIDAFHGWKRVKFCEIPKLIARTFMINTGYKQDGLLALYQFQK